MSLHSFIYEDGRAASLACARKIEELLREALSRQGQATLAVSGGTTPTPMFAELARAGMDWSQVHLFFVDERGVPPDDPQSNYKLVRESFIEASHFPAGNVHRIQAELPAATAAQKYANEIREFFHLSPGAWPQFDIIHRGMGPDAHTASLFPSEPLIADRHNLVAAVYVEKFHQWRITLLPGVLEAARMTLMLAAGEDKAEPLRSVLHEPYNPSRFPAQISTYDGQNVMWFLDQGAARLLG